MAHLLVAARDGAHSDNYLRPLQLAKFHLTIHLQHTHRDQFCLATWQAGSARGERIARHFEHIQPRERGDVVVQKEDIWIKFSDLFDRVAAEYARSRP